LFKKLIGDYRGLIRVLGFGCASRWLAAVIVNLPGILRARNLQPADRAMGPGPFVIRFREGAVQFRITGTEAFSGIREMYVRDTYLRGGALDISDGDVVLDLGANMGNFSNLALAHGPHVRVIAVEPNRALNQEYWSSLALNPGFTERAELRRVFLGEESQKQHELRSDPRYAGVEWVKEEEFLSSCSIDCVDFLKCDIEGGEFALLRRGGRLLGMTRKLAIEVHHFAGDVDAFVNMLVAEGFQIKAMQRETDGTATVLAARP
jgi:FkbM family methyltransferase